MGAEGVHEIIQRGSILHSTRTSHREQASNRDFTLGAAASEADLAPLYGAHSYLKVISKLLSHPPTRPSCTTYTRKSTEEGMEQEFNSLDAQRDRPHPSRQYRQYR